MLQKWFNWSLHVCLQGQPAQQLQVTKVVRNSPACGSSFPAASATEAAASISVKRMDSTRFISAICIALDLTAGTDVAEGVEPVLIRETHALG